MEVVAHREKEIKNPSLEFGDPKKSLLPTRYSYQQTESLPLFLSPTLCLSPPISLSSLLFPFSLYPSLSLPPLFLLPGTKGRRESRESGPAIPYWINQRRRPITGGHIPSNL